MNPPLRPRRTFVSIAYAPASGDPRVRRQCESLVRAGWTVYQIGLRARGEPAVGRLNGVVMLRTPQTRYRGPSLRAYVRSYTEFFFRARRLLRRIMEHGPVDAVQVTNLPNSLVWAARPARRRGAAVLLDIRDPVPEFFQCKFGDRFFGAFGAWCARLEEQIASWGADIVVTANEPHLRITAEHGVDPAKLRVVLNTADARFFPMTPPRPAGLIMTYSGTVAARMGIDVVLEAMAELKRTGLATRMLILGDGDAVPGLQRERERLGLQADVVVTGERFRIEELSERLAEVGIGLVPFRRDAFTDLLLSMKLLEYVRLGIPVLAIRTPTLAHYFPDDTVAYVDAMTPTAWAGVIRGVLADPEGARARAVRAQSIPVAQAWQDVSEPDFIALVAQAAADARRLSARPPA